MNGVLRGLAPGRLFALPVSDAQNRTVNPACHGNAQAVQGEACRPLKGMR
jgi:hypothetical protein